MKVFEISSLRGPSVLLPVHGAQNGLKEPALSPSKRYATKPAKASQRRRLQAHERLERDRRQAQRVAEALHQALEALGLPATLVVESAGRFRSQHQRLGKRVGVMCPALCGCRTPSALCRVRGWDTPWPSRMLGAFPTRSGLKRLRRVGLAGLEPLWRQVARKSPATQRRWQWTGVCDEAVCRKYGTQWGLVGTWWSGQHTRVLAGSDGLLLVVVIGDGRVVVPVDCALRRPHPVGPGAPCRDTWCGARTMRDERLAAGARRGVQLPPPISEEMVQRIQGLVPRPTSWAAPPPAWRTTRMPVNVAAELWTKTPLSPWDTFRRLHGI